MSSELDKAYNPKESEDKWYGFWMEKSYFHAEADKKKKPYSIVIPPPNITGILHMGHALNNTIQDILIRFKRMQGYASLWMPGTDHAGIATQNVVERMLAKKGIKRQDLGREKFVEEAWRWRDEYGGAIIKQLKRMGSSCDWQRERFTMDDGLSEAVIESFIRLYDKGLIYRGNYIINWCPRCQTALSDEEAPHRDLEGSLYHLKYPFKDAPEEYIIVATTRPETMLGDTAVAVNPKDRRYKSHIGRALVLPLIGREIKLIADGMVDMKFGTGAVKVTPAHDPNDYLLGKRHGLEFVNVMNPDGTMNDNAGGYKGMDRFEAREAILKDLKEKGLLEKTDPHRLSAGHCYRCHTIVEPYLSKQWFVKMKPLAKPAIDAVKKGKITFYPKRWTKVYLNWMENIQDWCISRQIWWGHRLPVYYCKNCQTDKFQIPNSKFQNPKFEKGVMVSKTTPDKCTHCGSADIYQDEDVLDTWFSSWLWPFSTFGWPFEKSKIKNQKSKSELDYFYPTSVLVTAQEIIFFWVARMIVAGMEFMKKIPFKDVYIHGTVRDDTGTKMSKSLNNTIDPQEIIDAYGTDALRFSIISITAVGQDVFLNKSKFEMGRNFANKIWNASRFLLMNIEEGTPRAMDKKALAIEDRWILSHLERLIADVTLNLDSYKFNEAALKLYDFFWHKFCDWYLELVKPVIVGRTQGIEHRSQKMGVALHVLDVSMRLLHPIIPFITEEIWQKLPRLVKGESIMASEWPKADKGFIDAKAEKAFTPLLKLITSIRNIRAEMNIPHSKKITIVVRTKDKPLAKSIEENAAHIKSLAGVASLDIPDIGVKRPAHCAYSAFGDIELFIPLEGVIDVYIEKKRLNKRVDELKAEKERSGGRLKDKSFLNRAPGEVVAAAKEREKELGLLIEKLESSLRFLE